MSGVDLVESTIALRQQKYWCRKWWYPFLTFMQMMISERNLWPSGSILTSEAKMKIWNSQIVSAMFIFRLQNFSFTPMNNFPSCHFIAYLVWMQLSFQNCILFKYVSCICQWRLTNQCPKRVIMIFMKISYVRVGTLVNMRIREIIIINSFFCHEAAF